MEALTQPIERVVEASRWFVLTPSVRVLHVSTSGLLRNPVLQHLTASELYEENTAPFFVLEAPSEPGDDGWALRCEELRADWEVLCASAPCGSPMGPLWPPRTEVNSIQRFVLELRSALAAVRSPVTGLVVVLAPVWVRDGARWQGDLTALLGQGSLSNARFVIVEADDAPSLPLIEELGARAERVDARVSDARLGREMRQRLDALRSAPAGAEGYALTGAAGPPVAPPKRKGAAAPLDDVARAAQAAATGVPAALLDPAVTQRLRVLLLSAGLSLRDGKHADAVDQQRQARDLCFEHGLVREGIVNALVLAGYVLQAGSAVRALELFREAAERAVKSDLDELAVQAHFGIGSCLLLGQRADEAAVAYAEGGRIGARAGAVLLAVEAYRMCGQLLASAGRDRDAAGAFQRALAAADADQPSLQPTSAPDAARALAQLLRKHGLEVQAAALDAQATELEARVVRAVAESNDGSASERRTKPTPA